jgi:hypothetical protein
MEWLLGKLIATPVIGAILGPIVNGLLTAQKQRLEAAGSHEARVADLAQKSLDLDKREAEVNASIVIAEQGHWFTRCIRPLLGLAVVVLVWKVIVYDKALGQWTGGSTDALDPKLWNVVMTIIISYMGGRTAERVADKIAGVFKKPT